MQHVLFNNYNVVNSFLVIAANDSTDFLSWILLQSEFTIEGSAVNHNFPHGQPSVLVSATVPKCYIYIYSSSKTGVTVGV